MQSFRLHGNIFPDSRTLWKCGLYIRFVPPTKPLQGVKRALFQTTDLQLVGKVLLANPGGCETIELNICHHIDQELSAI